MGGLLFFFTYYASPEYTDVGYEPDQPISYSHKFHVGTLGLDCRYCHSFVETSAEANIPATEKCMNCHQNIQKNSDELKKLKDTWNHAENIEWIKVHMLPDYAYFDHSVHINSKIGCASCHGRVDQMEKVMQVEPLSMSWCLDCHRDPAKHIRPDNVSVTQMDWVASDEHEEKMNEYIKIHKISPPEDCTACHR